MTAEEIFKKYRKLKEEQELIVIQIETFTGIPEEDVIQMLNFSSPDWGDRVQTSNTSDKTSQIAINLEKITVEQNKDYMDFLQEQYNQMRNEIRFFDTCIQRLGSPKADIMHDLMSGKYTWEEIMRNFNISRSTLGNYRKEFVERINEQLIKRNEIEMRYILS